MTHNDGGGAMTSDEFIAAALRNPANKTIVDELFHLALPDAWLVSCCLVQTVWNVITGRAVDYGIADYDVFYFTDHYRDYPMVLIRLSKAKRATVEPLLRRHWRTLASKKAVKEFDEAAG